MNSLAPALICYHPRCPPPNRAIRADFPVRSYYLLGWTTASLAVAEVDGSMMLARPMSHW